MTVKDSSISTSKSTYTYIYIHIYIHISTTSVGGGSPENHVVWLIQGLGSPENYECGLHISRKSCCKGHVNPREIRDKAYLTQGFFRSLFLGGVSNPASWLPIRPSPETSSVNRSGPSSQQMPHPQESILTAQFPQRPVSCTKQ